MEKRMVAGVVLGAALAAANAMAAPVAIEYLPPDAFGLAAGQVARINVVNGDGKPAAAGDVTGRTCRVELNWADAHGTLTLSPASFTLPPGESAFLDLTFDQAATPGGISGNRVVVQPRMKASCGSTLTKPAPATFTFAPSQSTLQATIEVYDADTGRSNVVISGNVLVRSTR